MYPFPDEIELVLALPNALRRKLDELARLLGPGDSL